LLLNANKTAIIMELRHEPRSVGLSNLFEKQPRSITIAQMKLQREPQQKSDGRKVAECEIGQRVCNESRKIVNGSSIHSQTTGKQDSQRTK